MSRRFIKLAGFKQTYWAGHHLTTYAEPALGFPSTQSPSSPLKKYRCRA